MSIPSTLATIFEFLMKFVEKYSPKKPDLQFEEIEASHWYNNEDDPVNQRCGINLKMYIINRGNKPTALRKFEIISMDPDYLDTIYDIHTNHTEIGIGKEIPYSDTYFFHTSDIRMDKIEFMLKITHTEGTKTLPMTSHINPRLARAPDEAPDESGPDIEIELENCYYTVNDQPISTIQAEFLVHNRGDLSTTVYEVEVMDIVLDLMDDILDPIFRIRVPIDPGDTVRMRASFSFPGVEMEGDIDLTLMIRYTHGQYDIACTALSV
jgi:hypothetical protein